MVWPPPLCLRRHQGRKGLAPRELRASTPRTKKYRSPQQKRRQSTKLSRFTRWLTETMLAKQLNCEKSKDLPKKPTGVIRESARSEPQPCAENRMM